MARWVPICQDCWYEVFPDQYARLTTFRMESENCARCGDMTFANIHVSPKEITEEAK